jgi:hypothetical protein
MSRTAQNAILPARTNLGVVAAAIEPILNRVVLAGPPVVELLVNDRAVRIPQLTFAADAILQLLSTSMVDRLGGDLQKLGLTRVGRSANGDRWRVSGEASFDLIQVRTDDGDSDQVWLEYATLLTLPFVVNDRITVRIAGAPAMLALECAAFEKSRASALDSEELERAVQLIAGRAEIERECTAAPPELRAGIAATLRRVAHNDSIQLIIQRALPDAAIVSALANRIRERMLRIAC